MIHSLFLMKPITTKKDQPFTILSAGSSTMTG